MRAGRIEREIAFSLGGWTGSRSGGQAIGDHYGSGYRVGALSEAIAKIHYDVPALSSLMERVEVLDPQQLCRT